MLVENLQVFTLLKTCRPSDEHSNGHSIGTVRGDEAIFFELLMAGQIRISFIVRKVSRNELKVWIRQVIVFKKVVRIQTVYYSYSSLVLRVAYIEGLLLLLGEVEKY